MSLALKKTNTILRAAVDRPFDELVRDLADIDVLTWVEENLKTDKGEPLDFESRPYLEMIYQDFHPNLVWYKAAQVGATQAAVGKMLFFASHEQVTVIYTFPTKTDSDEFAATRFDPIVRESPLIQDRLLIDNAGVKMIGDSKIMMRGTFMERQAISIPSDLNCHDELDFSRDDTIDTYRPRLTVSAWKWSWLFSTPTIPGYGVHREWKNSDQRMWVVKCQGCNKWQTVRWDKYSGKGHSNIMEKKTPGGRHLRWYFGCYKCGKELDRRIGMWVARKPNKNKIHGYHIPQTIVPIISADYMKEEEKRMLEKGRIKIFVNFNLGRVYESGITAITKDLLASRMREFGKEIWKSDRWFLGADQGDVVHWTLSRMLENRRVTVRFGTGYSFDELDDLFRDFNIVAAVLDAQPNKNDAKAFRDKYPGRVWICYYHDKQPAEMRTIQDKNEIVGTKNKEHFAITVDHVETLDRTTKEWVDGMALLHGNPTLVHNQQSPEGRFATQMENLKRDEVEDKHGNMRGVWKKTGADHYRHADNYNRLAVDIIGRNMVTDIRVGGEGLFDYNQPLSGKEWTSTESGIVVPVFRGRKD